MKECQILTFEVLRETFEEAGELAEWGAWPGDIILVDEGVPEPIEIIRSVPVSFQAIGQAIAVGALRPLNPESPGLAAFLERYAPKAKLRRRAPPAAPEPAGISRGALVLVKG